MEKFICQECGEEMDEDLDMCDDCAFAANEDYDDEDEE